jgi:uncharacterized protein (TIRG00374 family)
MNKKLKLLFAVIVIVCAIFVIKDIDLSKVYYLLKDSQIHFFVIAFFCFTLSFVIWNLRFTYSLNRFIRTGFLFSFLVLLAGCFFNTITPGAAVGGEPVRAYFISKRHNKPISIILGVVLGDKVYHLGVFVVFVLLAGLFLINFIRISVEVKIFIFLILGVAVFLFVYLFIILLKNLRPNIIKLFSRLYHFNFIKVRFATKDIFISTLEKSINKFIQSFKAVGFTKKAVFIRTFLSVVFWILVVFVSYFLFLSLGARVSVFTIWIVVFIGYSIADISPIPGGIGLAESSMFLLYSVLGVDSEVALLVAFLERFAYYFHTLVLGGFSLIYLRIGMKSSVPEQIGHISPIH